MESRRHSRFRCTEQFFGRNGYSRRQLLAIAAMPVCLRPWRGSLTGHRSLFLLHSLNNKTGRPANTWEGEIMTDRQIARLFGLAISGIFAGCLVLSALAS